MMCSKLTVARVLAVLFVSLRVGIEAADEPGEAVELPLVIYDDCESEAFRPYAASGWMGDVDAIQQNDCWSENPHRGQSCIRIDFTSGGWWSGVAWQHPMNDWGDRPGGYDLTKAKKLTFWARGAEGGEKVDFKYAILNDEALAYPDSCEGRTESVTLKREWRKYTIHLKGKRSRIKTGFAWTIPVTDKNITFFLDDIQYE